MKTSQAVLIGDVGPIDGIFHLGDEAMLERAIIELRLRGIETIKVISTNPDDTRSRYGVDSIDSPEIRLLEEPSWFDAEYPDTPKIERLSIHQQNQIEKLISTLDEADLLVITGGGNLNDIWPEKVLLRRIVSEIAHAKKTRIVVTGQSLGPVTNGMVREHVQRILSLADCIGVREKHSLKECQEMSVDHQKVFLNPDDAMFWPVGDQDLKKASPGAVSHDSYAIASFSSWHGFTSTPDAHLEVCADIVRKLLQVTGLPVALLPQEGSESGRRSHDVAFHDQIVHQISSDKVTSLEVAEISECVRLIGNASIVISSRYHPIVFSLAEGIPSIGVSVDHYTHAKIGGVVDMFSSLPVVVPAPYYRREDFESVLRIVWSHRHAIKVATRSIRSIATVRQKEWWDYLCMHGKIPDKTFNIGLSNDRKLVELLELPELCRLKIDCKSLSHASKTFWKECIFPLRNGQSTQAANLTQIEEIIESGESLKSNLEIKKSVVQKITEYITSLKKKF
jgi:polysaccharide pyruvyl transferase WcaK-like protein